MKKAIIVIFSIVIGWYNNGLCQAAIIEQSPRHMSVLQEEVNNEGQFENIDANNETNGNDNKLDNHMGNSSILFSWLMLLLAIITALVSIIAYSVKQQERRSLEFISCSKSLHSANPIEQAAAAIHLRSFISKKKGALSFFTPDYSKATINTIVELLGDSTISVSLKKTLGDGLSYADNLDGQDMQDIKMQKVCIKPPDIISFEINETKKLKDRKLSMKGADFFRATIEECSINSIDAYKAKFNYSFLRGTTFRNCILQSANFNGSNVSNVKFCDGCQLDNADFSNAIGLYSAVSDGFPLINYLDKNGLYHTNRKNSKPEYIPDKKLVIEIFESKLGIMDAQQKCQFNMLEEGIQKMIKSNGLNTNMVSIERSDYKRFPQLQSICDKLYACDGCIIYAFEYLNVEKGTIHKNVKGKNCQKVNEKSFASPWLHIEAALANIKQIPCMIIYEDNLNLDGMFNQSLVNQDGNLWAIPYTDDIINKKSEDFNNWLKGVMEYHKNHERKIHTLI